jgi:Fic family protein
MAGQIMIERKAYYGQLERAQKGRTGITVRILWFHDCLGRAIQGADASSATVLAKAQFWDSIVALTLSERNTKALHRFLDGFGASIQCRVGR